MITKQEILIGLGQAIENAAGRGKSSTKSVHDYLSSAGRWHEDHKRQLQALGQVVRGVLRTSNPQESLAVAYRNNSKDIRVFLSTPPAKYLRDAVVFPALKCSSGGQVESLLKALLEVC